MEREREKMREGKEGRREREKGKERSEREDRENRWKWGGERGRGKEVGTE